MTSEEDFQRHLDQHPDDHQTRQVFGDWLEEQGDPRANGYRALGKLQKQPHRFSPTPKSTNIDHTWFELEPGSSSHFEIPKDWFNLVQGHDEHSPDCMYKTFINRPRQHAEDAAAHAFNQLPPERQAELLGHHDPMLKSRNKPIVVSYSKYDKRRFSFKKGLQPRRYEDAPVATIMGEKPYHDTMPNIMKGSRLATVLAEIKYGPIGRNSRKLQELTHHALSGTGAFKGLSHHQVFTGIRDELLRSGDRRGEQLARDYNWHKMAEGLQRDRHLYDFINASAKGTKHENESTKFRRFYNGLIHGKHGATDQQRAMLFKGVKKWLYHHTGKVHSDEDIHDSLRRLGETEENIATINSKGLKGKDRLSLPQHIRPAYLGNPAPGKAPPSKNITPYNERASSQFTKLTNRRTLTKYGLKDKIIDKINTELASPSMIPLENAYEGVKRGIHSLRKKPILPNRELEHRAVHNALQATDLAPKRLDGESENHYQNRKAVLVSNLHRKAHEYLDNNNDILTKHYHDVVKNLENTAWSPSTAKAYNVLRTGNVDERLAHGYIPLIRHLQAQIKNEYEPSPLLNNPHLEGMKKAHNDSKYEVINDDTKTPDDTHFELDDNVLHPFSIEGLGGIHPDRRLDYHLPTNTDEELPTAEPLEGDEDLPFAEEIKRRKPAPNRKDIYKSIAEHEDMGWSAPAKLKDYLVQKHGITSQEAAIHIGNYKRRQNKPTASPPKQTKRVWPPIQRKSRNTDLMALPIKFAYNNKSKKLPKSFGSSMDEIYKDHRGEPDSTNNNDTHEINLDDKNNNEEPIKNSAVSAPAGGIIVRGTQYKGGERLPSMNGKFMNPKISRRRNSIKSIYMRVGDPNTHDAIIKGIVKNNDESGLGPFADFLDEQGAPGASLAREAHKNSLDPEHINPPFYPNEWWSGHDYSLFRNDLIGEDGQNIRDEDPLKDIQIRPEISRPYDVGKYRTGLLTTIHEAQNRGNNSDQHSHVLIHHVPVKSRQHLKGLIGDLPEPMKRRIWEHMSPHLRETHE